MRIGEAATYLGMSVIGVRQAAKAGRLASTISGGGHRLFDVADLDRYLGRPPAVVTASAAPRVEALYVRVSGTTGQESSLDSQEQQLRNSATGQVFKVYRDRASGLRDNRKALTRLLADAEAGLFTVVRVTQRDRLARFGTSWLEALLAKDGVTVEVLHTRVDPGLHQELLDDFMSLVASFSGRFYRLRSPANAARLLRETLTLVEDKAAVGTDG